MDVTPELLRALPKAELHVHLDGSLRPSTLIELARLREKPLPSDDPGTLARLMAPDDPGDLEAYLRRFETTLSVMQQADDLERIAYELARDAAAEGVRWLEVRWCPVLNTREGLSLAEAVEAPLRGLRRAEEEHGVGCGAILCALRSMDPAVSVEVARRALAFRDRGVVAFDLAGGERGHPAREHREAFRLAAMGDLPVTVHAGEADGPDSIRQALHDCGARRIGHGTRLHEDPSLLAYVRDFQVPLEVCLTSNVQTGVVPSVEAHPLRLYLERGLVVTLSTDNRLVSGTTLSREYALAHQRLGLGWPDLKEIALMGFRSAFLPLDEKLALLAGVEAELAQLEAAPG